ncbi:hypothetical protein TcBrA4_0000080 [Trypanosoma cruzi]|nr:hypothetical protein TcBrA4_0000080 [Trypanosoma cruzi]
MCIHPRLQGLFLRQEGTRGTVSGNASAQDTVNPPSLYAPKFPNTCRGTTANRRRRISRQKEKNARTLPVTATKSDGLIDAGLSCGDHISSTTKDEKEEKGGWWRKKEPTGDGELRSPQHEATVRQLRQGNPLTAESEDVPSHVPETSSEKRTTDLERRGRCSRDNSGFRYQSCSTQWRRTEFHEGHPQDFLVWCS